MKEKKIMFHSVKKLLKNVFYKFPVYKDDNLISKLENSSFDYVSFDVFDTLVKRNVFSPKDIYRMVSRDFFNDFAEQLEFVEARENAEKQARKLHKNNEEISLREIYDCIEQKFQNLKERLINEEIECELKNTYTNPNIKTVYDWCLKNNKKIIIISDMYLSLHTIKAILNNCGYKGYSKLYVSSEIGFQKATGNLYKYVLNDLSISPRSLIHIGDSLKGDYIQARLNRISSIRIATNPTRTHFINSINDNNDFWKRYREILSGHLYSDKGNYYLFAIESLSPLLYGFSKWLNNLVTKNKIQKLFFLARDGFLLEKVYSEICKNSPIEVRYLYVSRRALRLPVLYTINNYEDFVMLIPKNKFFSKKEFYDLFNFEESEKNYWNLAGLDDDELIYSSNLIDNDKVKLLFENIRACRECKESYDSFLEYLKINEFFNNVAIVDIGWAGTIQKCLEKICSDRAKICGFYLGLTQEAESGLNAYGYIPSVYRPQIATAGLLEYPFLANEGSLKCIRKVNGQLKINLCEYEYKNELKNYSYVQDMQKAVLDGVRLLNSIYENSVLIDPEISYKAIYEITKKPSLQEAKIFGDLKFYDGSLQPLALPKGIFFYMFNPKAFLREFSDSGWKVGFLKRLFKFPLPYFIILDFLRTRK